MGCGIRRMGWEDRQNRVGEMVIMLDGFHLVSDRNSFYSNGHKYSGYG